MILTFIYRKCFAALVVVLTLSGCENERNSSEPHVISSDAYQAESVFLTKDNLQRPVICWVERDTVQNRHHFLYSVLADGKAFREKASIPVPREISTHAEGMPKVAFKKDGTIIAAYEQSTPTPKNKWAGAIYYLFSKDNGKSWSSPQYLHSDTISGRSRGFFDLATLPDGEVGAAWLDIKSDDKEKGRTVRFAKTFGDSFVGETTLEEYACECCRIDLYADASTVTVAYRSVRKANFNQIVRDMMFVTSKDNGNFFTTPQAISPDKWLLDKCPHSGPSIASNSSGLHSAWFTEGNGVGVYFSSLENGAFVPRTLVSNGARFPQMAGGKESVLLVWTEQSDGGSPIRFEKRLVGKTETGTIGKETSVGFYPVSINVHDEEYLIAYLGVQDNQPRVFYTKR